MNGETVDDIGTQLPRPVAHIGRPDGGAWVLAESTGSILDLNATAIEVWLTALDRGTGTELVRYLGEKYGLDAGELEPQIHHITTELINSGLLAATAEKM